jgi:hypothetical protein
MAAARAGIQIRSTSLSSLTLDDLRVFDNTTRSCQSSNAGRGPLGGHERIDEMLRGRELLVARHETYAQFTKLHIKDCSFQSLKLLVPSRVGNFLELHGIASPGPPFRP